MGASHTPGPWSAVEELASSEGTCATPPGRLVPCLILWLRPHGEHRPGKPRSQHPEAMPCQLCVLCFFHMRSSRRTRLAGANAHAPPSRSQMKFALQANCRWRPGHALPPPSPPFMFFISFHFSTSTRHLPLLLSLSLFYQWALGPLIETPGILPWDRRPEPRAVGCLPVRCQPSRDCCARWYRVWTAHGHRMQGALFTPFLGPICLFILTVSGRCRSSV